MQPTHAKWHAYTVRQLYLLVAQGQDLKHARHPQCEDLDAWGVAKGHAVIEGHTLRGIFRNPFTPVCGIKTSIWLSAQQRSERGTAVEPNICAAMKPPFEKDLQGASQSALIILIRFTIALLPPEKSPQS